MICKCVTGQLANKQTKKDYYYGQYVELRALDQVELEAPRDGTLGPMGAWELPVREQL